MAYTPTNWTNFPSTATPVNASNLNKIENELVALDTDKVDKEQGKGLSTNDYDNTAKGIVDGVTTALEDKVDKVSGKGLSTNDFDNTYKDKLDGISEQANKVEITPVVTEGTTLATISIDGVDTAIKGSDIDVDDEMSPTSENPVQNKVIYEALNNILPEETAEGNPISITDASGLSSKSCEVTFSPIQSGSGDPSPVNVRPIRGRDSLVLNQCGKNIFDYTKYSISNITYEKDSVHATQTRSGFFYYPKSGTYTFKDFWQTVAQYMYMFVLNSDGTFKKRNVFSTSTSTEYSVITETFANGEYCAIVSATSGTTMGTSFRNNLQIEVGSTASDTFIPYSGTTHTATFPSTVYGGEYEFVSGEDSIKFAIKTLTGAEGINWSLSGTQTLYRDSALLPNIRVGTSRIYGVCSACPSIEASTGELYINNSYMDKPSASSKGIEFKQVIDFWGLEEATSTALNAKLAELYANGTPLQICYELATPTEITLTAEQIELLKGQNVLWTDGDNITLKYSADIKSYIAEQLSSLS